MLIYKKLISEHSSVGVSEGFGSFIINEYKYDLLDENAFLITIVQGLYYSGLADFGKGGRTKYRLNKKEM